VALSSQEGYGRFVFTHILGMDVAYCIFHLYVFTFPFFSFYPPTLSLLSALTSLSPLLLDGPTPPEGSGDIHLAQRVTLPIVFR